MHFITKAPFLFNSRDTFTEAKRKPEAYVLINRIFLYFCRYETLNTAETKQKQSKSTGDLLDMVSFHKAFMILNERCFGWEISTKQYCLLMENDNRKF